ncbi:MAG: hypothetical protein K8S98_10970 [Planctomycetes bacterium]|nr:hypothetical protein [Planctomycetota bacterium]
MHKLALASFALAASLTTLAWLPLPGGDECRRVAEADAKVGAEGGRELFFAVLEGLYADGVSDAAVDAVLEVDRESELPANFVKGCPICTPAFDAFRAYRARPAMSTKSAFGSGLAGADEDALVRGDAEQRFQVSGRLVQGWIRRHLDDRKLTYDDRAAWARAMEAWRKKGMATLEQLRASERPGIFAKRKSCSMCDAANGACKL